MQRIRTEFWTTFNFGSLTTDDATTVGEVHLTGLDEGLEDAGDVRWSLVRLINNEDVSELDGTDKRRVLIHDDAILDGRLERQSLECCVAGIATLLTI